MNILDDEFALEQARVFENDKSHSRRITLEQYDRRPWREKVMERACELLRSQL